MAPTHEPVMVEECLAALNPLPGQVLVDATLGLGGHSIEFCRRIAPDGILCAFDKDPEMFANASQRLRRECNVTTHLFNESFTQVPRRLEELGLLANGMLFDLGLNNAQIEDRERGFSFRDEAPLDMRIDPRKGPTAAEWLNHASRLEIANTLYELGDERWAKRIADAIVDRRPLQTTAELVACVEAAVPRGARTRGIHPATRTFQAVRIRVNDELGVLDGLFERCAERLAPKGAFAVLSYHSGEDRVVKRAFRTLGATNKFELLNKRPIRPSEAEVERNRKSRSARLRSIKKTQ